MKAVKIILISILLIACVILGAMAPELTGAYISFIFVLPGVWLCVKLEEQLTELDKNIEERDLLRKLKEKTED